MTIKENIEDLAKDLPTVRNEGTSNHWAMVCQDIKNRIIIGDIENFLRWHNVKETMVVTSKTLAEYEYSVLSKSSRWTLYKEAVKNLNIGNPIPSEVYPETNNNAIHQLYHLHIFESKYGPVENCDKIIEFGGGYGCLCSIIRKLGFTGEYIIIDFPEFHLIQKYYLNSLGIYNFKQEMPKKEDFSNATFFAFWSLSETEIGFRIHFIDNYLSNLKNFLMAYQLDYEGQDNIPSFDRIKAYLPFNIEEIHLGHIPQNYYILGDRK